MKSRSLVWGFGLMSLLLAGCVSAEPTYYTLAAFPGNAQPDRPRTIRLNRPGLAGYLDRSTVVSRVVDYRLTVSDGERWGEPLGDMMGRVLAEDLTQRLPGASVFAEAGAISVDPDAVVSIDVQRFDAGSDGIVTLVAQVVVEQGHSRVAEASRSFRLSARPFAPSTPALVAAMSAVLGQLADQIAYLVRAT